MSQVLSRDNRRLDRSLLDLTTDIACGFLSGVPERPVSATIDAESLRSALTVGLPEEGEQPERMIAELARILEPGLIASPGPRYFGFVTGGSLPAALAADWLTSAWDQNACLQVMSPAAAAVEAATGAWLAELFGLPGTTSVGFTTGATTANFTALAAARHAVLARVGWDVETAGLVGAPAITVVAGAEVHASVLAALQMLGLGRERVRRVAADAQGRLRPDALCDVLAASDDPTAARGPLIVCAQAGNVNSGACDPLDAIAPAVHARGGWLHVDGAFGLWAAVVPALQSQLRGLALADSWATDAHKWLNVPYDSGVVLVRDASAHRAAMTVSASYLVAGDVGARDGADFVPELSRRARGIAVYAALRSLGRRGVATLVARCCALACRMAERLSAGAGVAVLNDVVLNQVLVRFTPSGGGDADTFTRAVIRRVQAEGTCWAGGTVWHGVAAMRLSVSNWSTTEADVDRSAAAILACARAAAAELTEGEPR